MPATLPASVARLPLLLPSIPHRTRRARRPCLPPRLPSLAAGLGLWVMGNLGSAVVGGCVCDRAACGREAAVPVTTGAVSCCASNAFSAF